MHSVWKTSIRYTLVTAVLLGLGYPLVVTGIAGVLLPHKAGGSLILKDGQVIGSELLAQSFTSDRYFHPRPSAAAAATTPAPRVAPTWPSRARRSLIASRGPSTSFLPRTLGCRCQSTWSPPPPRASIRTSRPTTRSSRPAASPERAASTRTASASWFSSM